MMENIQKALTKYWGYDSFLPLQKQAMECISRGTVFEKDFLPSIKHVWIEAVPIANVRNRLLFDQMQAEKPDFPLRRKLFTFVCREHFLSLIYILTQIQEMSNSD